MDKIARYKKIISEELTHQSDNKASDMPDIYNQLIIGKDGNQFVLFVMGWHRKEYIHNVAFHIEVREEKVWIHEDKTDVGIARVFVNKGIPEKDIVLGFARPYSRASVSTAAH
ncbi:MAG: XisI protein [Phaeodactylibacter sp.]|nr:XisI protein [Phaeodactylibacter sp.]